MVFALPAVSSAATTDFAYGAGVSTLGTPFAFSARSAADGSAPAGRAILGGIFGNSEGPVTCLRVQDNVAAIGYRIERSSVPSLIGRGYVGYLQDNGAFANSDPVDKGDAVQVAQAPASCPAADPARADVGLYGETVVKDNTTLPPPPADPTWSINSGTIRFGRFLSFNMAAMRIADGSAIGYAELTGTEDDSPMYGKVICLDVDGRTAITGIERDETRSRVTERAAQIASIDGRATGGSTGTDSISIAPLAEDQYPGDVECKPPYPDPYPLTSGDVINRSGDPLPPPPVRCGATLRKDTTLQSDLNCDGYGLKIGAPGITVDLAGHSVTGQGVSILDQGYDNVTIKTGFIGVPNQGIIFEGVNGSVIRDVSLSGLQHGITLTGSDHNWIVGNRLLSVWMTIRNGSDSNIIRGNTVLSYEGFISIYNSSRNLVTKNVISNGMETGVSLSLADHSLVNDNDFTVTNGRGVSLNQSDDNEVSDNTMRGLPNGDNPISVHGIDVTDSHRNLLLGNSFQDTTTAIEIVSGWANTLRQNQGLFSVADTFLVDADAVGTSLLGNWAHGGGGDGFDIRSPSSRLGNNTATYNTDLGIRAVAGVTDLGGNQAFGNQNAFQCLNVVCH
jgi:parallel beta-helix repeat protein